MQINLFHVSKVLRQIKYRVSGLNLRDYKSDFSSDFNPAVMWLCVGEIKLCIQFEMPVLNLLTVDYYL